ncbi:MAG: hypothetical protein M1817_002335 [Caeruleum heppii]|nr:MAG: hypothetical protein M1817_003480 [Caeruleum heppii]KAI9673697.1 MAG: hypothetical protein M1817_002335 [Caeruleum heppii]
MPSFSSFSLALAASVLLSQPSYALPQGSSTPVPPSLSAIKLTGNLLSNSEHPEIVEIQVVNKGDTAVSVLAWNNVFDTRHMSKPFDIVDENGADILLGSSHIRYAHIIKDDFVVIAPGGGHFMRSINLTEYVINMPGQPASQNSALLSLPSAVSGFNGDAATSTFPEAVQVQWSTNDTESSAPVASIPGSIAPTSLSKISLASSPLRLNVTVPAGAPLPELAKRASVGMMVNLTECTGDVLDKARDGVRDAGRLALAAQHSMKAYAQADPKPAEHPFPYWFGSECIRHQERIANILDRVQSSAQSTGGAPIVVQCRAETDRRPNHQPNCEPHILGFHMFDHARGVPNIVLCPEGQRLRSNLWPCSTPAPGSAGDTIGALVLHEALHVPTLVGMNFSPRDDAGTREVYKPGPAHNLVVNGGDPLKNPDNYAYLSSFSWDLGYGGAPWEGDSCLDHFQPPPAWPGWNGQVFGP